MQENNNIRYIDAYSLADFLVEVQKAFQDGYVLDLDSNANYPQAVGTRYFAGMVQSKGQAIKVVATEDNTDDTKAPQRGRKPKV